MLPRVNTLCGINIPISTLYLIQNKYIRLYGDGEFHETPLATINIAFSFRVCRDLRFAKRMLSGVQRARTGVNLWCYTVVSHRVFWNVAVRIRFRRKPVSLTTCVSYLYQIIQENFKYIDWHIKKNALICTCLSYLILVHICFY